MECIVLGGIILDNSQLVKSEHIKRLRPQDFFNTSNGKIFAAMLSLRDQGKEIDYVPVIDELKTTGMLEQAGGEARISGLTDGLPTINQASQAAEIVKRLSLLRQQIDFAKDLEYRARKYGANPLGNAIFIRDFGAAAVQEVDVPAADIPVLTLADMPETCLDGFLGALCKHRLLSRGFPVAYAWPALVTVAGTLVSPTPNVPTNIFCALVGAIGTGKTQAVEQSIALLGLAPPQLQQTMAGSAEGLLVSLENAAGDGRLISVDELIHLFIKATIDRATFPSILNRAYDKTEFDIIIARQKKIHVNCRLGVTGGVVEDNFQSCFGAATTLGLYDRFVFGQCPRPHKFNYRPFEGPAEKPDPCTVTIAPDVWETVQDWIKAMPALAEGRPVELAIRFATIAAAFSGQSVLRACHLAPARAFAEYQCRVRALLQPNPGLTLDAQCAFAILSSLPSSGAWINERILSKQIHSDRFGPGIFRRAVESLIFNGEIERGTVGRGAQLRKLI
jgi:hypothetical protein